MYKVAKAFIDSADGFKEYAEGDAYPREGYAPAKERITQLKKSKHIVENKEEVPEVLEEEEAPKKE